MPREKRSESSVQGFVARYTTTARPLASRPIGNVPGNRSSRSCAGSSADDSDDPDAVIRARYATFSGQW